MEETQPAVKKSLFKIEGPVAEYYKQKSRLEIGDEFHTRIQEKDINILQKSLAMVAVAPFITVAVMHLLRLLKKDMSFSERFMYRIRTAQDTLFTSSSTYQRSADRTKGPQPVVPGAESRLEAETLKNLYNEIKEDEAAMHNQKVDRMRSINEQIANRGQQPRIRNASPFYKNQQAKRFGIDGARIISSNKERNIQKRENSIENSASKVFDNDFIEYRDNQRIQGHPLSHQLQANKIQDQAIQD